LEGLASAEPKTSQQAKGLPSEKFGGLGSCRAETLEGWFSAQLKNRLNVGRGFTPRRKSLSAGYKTLPYKEIWQASRLAL